MPNSVMPDSVMLNSYLMLYHIPLYHFPLYLIPDCPLECYNRFLFSVIPDSIISDSVIPDSCFDIPDSVMPNSGIPDSSFACYNRFRYTRFPAPQYLADVIFADDQALLRPLLPLSPSIILLRVTLPYKIRWKITNSRENTWRYAHSLVVLPLLVYPS